MPDRTPTKEYNNNNEGVRLLLPTTIAPFPERYYEHYDLHLRCYENGCNISDPIVLQSWRNSEPILMGSPTLTIPIYHNTPLQMGSWQSTGIMVINLDGPRIGRTVGIQWMGYQHP